MIGRDREGRAILVQRLLRGTNQNTECIHDGYLEVFVLLLANQNAEERAYAHGAQAGTCCSCIES